MLYAGDGIGAGVLEGSSEEEDGGAKKFDTKTYSAVALSSSTSMAERNSASTGSFFLIPINNTQRK